MPPKEKESQEQPAGHPADSPHPALKLRHTLQGHTGNVFRMALSPNGRILASPSGDQTVRLWDVENGRLLLTIEHPAVVACAAWSPDGTMLVTGTGGEYTRVYLWEATTGRRILVLGEHGHDVCNVAWAPVSPSVRISTAFSTCTKSILRKARRSR